MIFLVHIRIRRRWSVMHQNLVSGQTFCFFLYLVHICIRTRWRVAHQYQVTVTLTF